MSEAPELYVNSRLDQHTDDVAAFEDLVGHPHGSGDALHRVLVAILERLGHRRPERTRGRGRRAPDDVAAGDGSPPVTEAGAVLPGRCFRGDVPGTTAPPS